MDDPSDQFEEHRAHLESLGYRMLGSVAEAEDVVQDAYLRWHGVDRAAIDNPRAFLSKIVTRLCLDRMKSAQSRREIYVGPWLPEPLVTDAGFLSDPSETVADDVSFALMLALERLSPLERAAFILRDVFDIEFDEIATALDRSAATCRQLVSRARYHIKAARPRFAVAPEDGARIAEAFFDAAHSGDPAALRDMLAEAASLHTDGGGRKPAALNVIAGADKVGRYFAGLFRKGKAKHPLWTRRLIVNGLPGCATLERDGTLQTTALEIADGRIAAIYVTRNPDKLGQLAPFLPGWVAAQHGLLSAET
ncbi:MAG: sigma-70 family RNA polymerase sigma factor [Dichotomicrobium sp.]